MSLAHNERVKLTATALNNTAIATAVAGLVVPAVSFFYGLSTVPTGRFWWLIGLAWLGGALGLHYAARVVLRGLRP